MTFLLAVLRRVPLRVYVLGALGLVAVLFVSGLKHQIVVARKERDEAVAYAAKLEALVKEQNHAIELMQERSKALQQRVNDAEAHAQQIDKQTGVLLSEIKNQPVPNQPMQALVWLAQIHNKVVQTFNQ